MSTTTALVALAALAGAAAQTCPLADEFGFAFPNGAEDADALGGLVVRGFDAANAAACEYCGVTTRHEAPGLPTEEAPGTYYGYDFKWNKLGEAVLLTRQGLEAVRRVFLGESCASKSDCAHGFTDPYVDVTCAPTSPDAHAPDLRCVLDEEATWLATRSLESTCECFGLLYCHSDDCDGNMCVLSTYDMQKHCKYADDDGFTDVLFGSTQCSNCRGRTLPVLRRRLAYGRRLAEASPLVLAPALALLVVAAAVFSAYVCRTRPVDDVAPVKIGLPASDPVLPEVEV
ncbi:glutamine amidotransferase class-I [Aureococcus anophagefferens]|nr:glutamine amidotransferase class-I [Aureococcus anophagefferens]